MERPLTGSTIGLCGLCRHARAITSARGSTFWRCALSDTDERFAKYPRLPVTSCPGFAEREDASG